LTAAIKLLQAKQRKNMYQAASRAVDRALAAANDALGDDDPDEIEEVRQQLSAKLREMEAAAAYLDGDPLLQDGEKLQEAEKSLRKLGKKKTTLLHQNDVGNSPVF
jgi:galactokinase